MKRGMPLLGASLLIWLVLATLCFAFSHGGVRSASASQFWQSLVQATREPLYPSFLITCVSAFGTLVAILVGPHRSGKTCAHLAKFTLLRTDPVPKARRRRSKNWSNGWRKIRGSGDWFEKRGDRPSARPDRFSVEKRVRIGEHRSEFRLAPSSRTAGTRMPEAQSATGAERQGWGVDFSRD